MQLLDWSLLFYNGSPNLYPLVHLFPAVDIYLHKFQSTFYQQLKSCKTMLEFLAASPWHKDLEEFFPNRLEFLLHVCSVEIRILYLNQLFSSAFQDLSNGLLLFHLNFEVVVIWQWIWNY